MFAAFAEMKPAILRQRREPGYHMRKNLPPTALPHREEWHQQLTDRVAMRVWRGLADQVRLPRYSPLVAPGTSRPCAIG